MPLGADAPAMASVHRSPGEKTWRVCWRTPEGQQRSKRGFKLRSEAMAYGVRQESAKLDGLYVDPKAGKVTLGTYAARWAQAAPHRPSTSLSVQAGLRCHVLPVLGHRPLAAVRPSEVQAAVKCWSQTLAPGTVRNLLSLTTAIFRSAVADGLLVKNPIVGVKLPRSSRSEVVPMTASEVRQMASTVPERYRGLILVAAGTGVRQGELLGLALDRIDWLRREIRIDRQLVTLSGRPPTFGPPKGEASCRTIVVPDAVLQVLSEQVRTFPGELVFTDSKGDPIRRNAIGHVWRRAAPVAGVVDRSFHDLRHYAASGLIAAGLSVVAVQRHLGHASATTTLNTYAHLWPSDGDRTRAALADLLAPVATVLSGETLL